MSDPRRWEELSAGVVEDGTRIAVWSGPRNISTALLRAWGSREDTVVCDEPLYAHYLLRTGIDHPGREEVIASQENDWRVVVAQLTEAALPPGKRIFYQKHMAHHLLPEMGREWVGLLKNALLIRDPREMLSSLIQVTPRPTVEDTGLPQQVLLFEELCRREGRTPPVVDARDVLANPRGMLDLLCTELGVPFDEAMLAWEPGPRSTDGVWAKYWYAAVEWSTGFQPYQPRPDGVPGRLRPVYEECIALYEELYPYRLTV